MVSKILYFHPYFLKWSDLTHNPDLVPDHLVDQGKDPLAEMDLQKVLAQYLANQARKDEAESTPLKLQRMEPEDDGFPRESSFWCWIAGGSVSPEWHLFLGECGFVTSRTRGWKRPSTNEFLLDRTCQFSLGADMFRRWTEFSTPSKPWRFQYSWTFQISSVCPCLITFFACVLGFCDPQNSSRLGNHLND